MRVLWFTNTLFPEVCNCLGCTPNVGGGWMHSLGHLLRASGKVDLAIATVVSDIPAGKYEIDGITHYVINRESHSLGYDVGRVPAKALLAQCVQVVEDFAPALVHIHGTESFYGLLSGHNLLTSPAVISIQGLIHVYERYYLGSMSISEIVKSNFSLEWFFHRSLLQEQWKWRKRGRLEQQVIASNSCFIGRTRWDKAHVLALNPQAQFYNCWEMMREPFYRTHWRQDSVRPYTIFCTSGSYPLKGFHWLLKAVAILQGRFPDISLRIADALPGGRSDWKGYNRLLRGLIRKLHLSKSVVLLGRLTAEEVAQELALAQAYVIPSLIENSPNSLSEAMLVGTPCVASLCGGIPSMVEDGKTALCFPPGDAAVMAECIRMIFTNTDLALSLSSAGRAVALERHDATRITDTMLQIYTDIINKGVTTCSHNVS